MGDRLFNSFNSFNSYTYVANASEEEAKTKTALKRAHPRKKEEKE